MKRKIKRNKIGDDKIEGAKIGSQLRIRLPSMYSVTDYDPDKTLNLKKWAIQEAQSVKVLDQDGNSIQPDIIKTAQKIYNWVTK